MLVFLIDLNIIYKNVMTHISRKRTPTYLAGIKVVGYYLLISITFNPYDIENTDPRIVSFSIWIISLCHCSQSTRERVTSVP